MMAEVKATWWGAVGRAFVAVGFIVASGIGTMTAFAQDELMEPANGRAYGQRSG
jgi:hypothetical protein